MEEKHTPYEADEQEALFAWAALMRAQLPGIELMYHIPNGGSRNRVEAARLKGQGVKPGVPDICLPVARRGYHGLYIELKVGRNKPTKNQIEWITSLRKQGYAAVVCYGWAAAAKIIRLYYGEGKENEIRESSNTVEKDEAH